MISHPRAESDNAGVLYISYDGMLEPLGQSQVLAYLERLAADRRIHLLSFEKSKDYRDINARDAMCARIAAAGIYWHPRRYHKHPSALATAWDIGMGTLSALWLVWRYRLRIVHARSYVASAMALVVKSLTGRKFVFDMRGFWADERVDGGLWPRDGRMYGIAKWFERNFLCNADHVLSLTHAAVAEMQRFDYLKGRMPPISVIPTCADLDRFRPQDDLRHDEGFTLGYVGTAGTWYLFDTVARAMRLLLDLRADARLLVINRSEHIYIREHLRAAGVPDDRVELRSANHASVAAQMARMDAGIFFIKPVFSKQASAPTKLAELLGCGIPCLGNTGVGDMAAVLKGEGVGVVVDEFDDVALRAGLSQLLALCEQTGTRERCVAVAHRYFSLEEGVRRYAAIYMQFDKA